MSGVVCAETYNPKADEKAVVQNGSVRFTILTPRVIRMEWSEEKQFTDQGTLVFVNRRLPVPSFEQSEKDGWLKIKTDALELSYKSGSGRFTAENLKIDFATGGMEKSWVPGTENSGNLRGTIRTLDGWDGDYSLYDKKKLDLEPGVLSRDGWVMIDDTGRPMFDDSEWSWVQVRPETAHQDFYFFAYGNDYKTALGDFTKIAGRVALPPRYVFGYWYSRWRAFSEMEFRELVGDFERYDIPLDVLVIDMDWHIVSRPEFFDEEGARKKDQAGESFGWTGFTWNKNFFPDPKRFLDWTREHGLKTCLNLHPASGIQPHESMYEAMATAMGQDPAEKIYVPFNITDKTFARNYFDLVLHPMEEQGIDFWWLDWQQWNTTEIPGVNPTFYLNYVHYTDMERENKVRPLIYHRWGGLGNHRYQLGFSGDTKITWKSLDYAPYFTATASNVGFGYWGNDIGGFMWPEGDTPELYTRWFQFGIFSPIVKTHSQGDPRVKRRPWQFPHEIFSTLRDLLDLRYSLIPYIYTAAHQTYETGISLCRPMYYDYPEAEEAYTFKNQYMFGDDMLVHPITRAHEEGRLFTMQAVWLPEGDWYEWFSGTLISGGRTVERPFTIDEIPLYVKAGSVIPMQPKMRFDGEKPVDPLILSIVPGEGGDAGLYEDHGNNNDFKSGQFTITPVVSTREENVARVEIQPVEGQFGGMMQRRSYEVRFLRTLPPKTVEVNGDELAHNLSKEPGTWYYDGETLTTHVFTQSYKTGETKVVLVEFPEMDESILNGAMRKMAWTYDFTVSLADHRGGWVDHLYPRDVVLNTAQTGIRMTAASQTAVAEMKAFDANWKKCVETAAGIAGRHSVFKPFNDLLQALSEK